KVDVQDPFPPLYGTRAIAPDGARYFGPYRSGRAVRTMVNLVQRLFPIRTCTRRLSTTGGATSTPHGGPCLRYALGRCLGPCHGGVSSEQYPLVVREVCDFLGGTPGELLAGVGPGPR